MFRFLWTGTTQAGCKSEGEGPKVFSVVSDTRDQSPQLYFRGCWFTMDPLPICCCTFWRQVFRGIMDLCTVTLSCMLYIIIFAHSDFLFILGQWTRYWPYHWNFGKQREQPCYYNPRCFPNPCRSPCDLRNANARSRNNNLCHYSQHCTYMWSLFNTFNGMDTGHWVSV